MSKKKIHKNQKVNMQAPKYDEEKITIIQQEAFMQGYEYAIQVLKEGIITKKR